MKTKSEKLFESFCNNNRIEAKKISETNENTPDYEVKIDSKLVICEIKQLDVKKEESRERDKVLQGHAIVYYPLNRTSNKLLDISRQVKEYAKKQIPTIVVLYNNVPLLEYLNHDEIFEAMFGSETNVVTFKNDEILNISQPSHGGNRRFTQTHNTSVSALAVLENKNDGILLMRVYHNPFAQVPLNPEICKSLPIKQYIYKKNAVNNFGSWQQI